MNSFINWCKQDKKNITLIKAGVMACLPIICCLVYCGVHGISISSVYLPASEWNDELFYFKQVEGIINYGYPQGYFGFNESHALKLSFAAWSPVLVFPWIIWGLLFGWNLMSPIICNIVLLTIAVFLFVWLVKPTWKQLGILTLLFCFYPQFVRYMFSGMPEIICFSMLIVFYALAYNYLQNEKNYKLVILFVMGGVMTLMRPYLLLFLLLPMYLWIRKNVKVGIAGSFAVLAIVGTGYVLIKRYLGAEYFAPLFFTEWITKFFTDGIGAGIHNFFGTLYYMGKAFLNYMKQGFVSGLAAGAFFIGYITMMIIFIVQSLTDVRRVRKMNAAKSYDVEKVKTLKSKLILELHLLFCFVAMLFALLLMYKLTEGSKHLLTFMAAGLFVISLMDTRFYKKAIVICAVFAYLYTYKAVDPYDYAVPVREDELVAQVNEWQDIFAENMSIEDGEDNPTPNFDNVCIWVFSDEVDGVSVNEKWQLLYSLPKGFGVSCCMPDYVTENLYDLNSRYIAVVSGGKLDAMCMDAGYTQIGRDKDLVVYERYR